MEEWIQQLYDEKVGIIKLNEPLANHTSWKLGGPADLYIIPEDYQGLSKTIEILNNWQIAWKILGKGSNLLVLDKGFRGAIISLNNKSFQKIIINDSCISVGASVSLIRLANLAAKEGLTGLEFAGGIPGTVGGAIYMNAGAHGSDIFQVLVEAEVLTENGEIVTISKDYLQFSYRTSIFQQKEWIILSAVFQLKFGDRKEIASKMAQFKLKRKNSQPYNLPCSGSVFRNPEGDFAGRLIEQIGLKSFQIGGAQVSDLHANFIVNVNEATAKDVLELIEHIQRQVYEIYGINLNSEVELLGEG